MHEIDPSVVALKNELASRGARGLALDIDETLAFTNKLFFEALFEKFGNIENISIEAALEKYANTHNVPYWQTDEIKQFLVDHRRDLAVQAAIEPIAEAVDGVREIATHIPLACYVTARPESVREATETWLKKHGFPTLPLIMRPDAIDDSHITTWKGPTLEYLYPNVVGIIDDDQKFTETVSPAYGGTLFLYSKAEPRQAAMRIIGCPTWQAVVEAVQTYAKQT